MRIISVPHPTLRKKAQALSSLTKKGSKQLRELATTLEHQTDPPGVGLAAPQVNLSIRAFATLLTATEVRPEPARVFVNPVIVDHADRTILGETAGSREPYLEGCLSIPYLYGSVPRWEWLVLEYQTVLEHSSAGNEYFSEPTRERFVAFAARVIQHELDHLDGILFVDHTIKHGLELFRGGGRGEKLESVDPAEISF